MTYPLRTLAHSVTFSGRGLHGGEPVTVVVHPRESGIVFRRGADRVEAHPDAVTDTRRCTCLGPVATVEHLMSAFGGLGVTGAEVEVDGPELPALDGSAAGWVRGLIEAGFEELGDGVIEGPFARVYEKSDDHSIAIGSGDGWWRYTFDMGTRWPGVQDFEVHPTPEVYAAEVAPARTFGFEAELPAIRAAGLAQGLDASSALVVGEGAYVNEARFPDEPARHKMLDLIGDLYLSGVPILHLNVVAERSGHAYNVRAAQKLAVSVRFGRA